jgi:hypothetical protein
MSSTRDIAPVRRHARGTSEKAAERLKKAGPENPSQSLDFLALEGRFC